MAGSPRWRRWRAAALAVIAAPACDWAPYRSVTVEAQPAPGEPAAGARPIAAAPLRFSVASIESPRDTFPGYQRLFDRVGRLMDRDVEFVQRRTYREVNDLLISGQLDAALLCTGGYIDLQKRAPGSVEAVAAPVMRGSESYRSVILVPAASGAREVADLRGRHFAFSDELSLSGHLYALHLLREMRTDPDRFFGAVTFTGSHDRSVQAVAAGLVDGAAVHGAVLDVMEAHDPSLGQRVRVLHRSPPLGAMPVVASLRLPAATRARIRDVLLALEHDPEGRAALRIVHVDRFAPFSREFYASSTRIVEGR